MPFDQIIKLSLWPRGQRDRGKKMREGILLLTSSSWACTIRYCKSSWHHVQVLCDWAARETAVLCCSLGRLPGNAGNGFTIFRTDCREGGVGQAGKNIEMGKTQQTATWPDSKRVQTTRVLIWLTAGASLSQYLGVHLITHNSHRAKQNQHWLCQRITQLSGLGGALKAV